MDDDFRKLYATASPAVSVALVQLAKLKSYMDFSINQIVRDLEEAETKIDKMCFEKVKEKQNIIKESDEH